MDYMQDSLKKQPLTVQDFIAAHGGYVDLTVAQAAELLTGQNMSGHPGCPRYDREMPVEELLPQVIANCNYHEGAWYIISDHSELEQSNVGMEVTMC